MPEGRRQAAATGHCRGPGRGRNDRSLLTGRRATITVMHMILAAAGLAIVGAGFLAMCLLFAIQ